MIVAGFGCSSQAGEDSLHDLFAHMAQLARPDMLTCLEGRAALLAPLAQATGLPLVTLNAGQIRGIETPTQSARILAAFGTGSVAEACALVVAGGSAGRRGGREGAVIAAARVVSQDGQVTGALARWGMQ